MKRRFCAAVAAVMMSIMGVAGGGWPSKATAVPGPVTVDASVVTDPLHQEHAVRLAEFAEFLEMRRQARLTPPRPIVSPFAQLDELGLNGTGLLDAVEQAGIKIGVLAQFDLRRINIGAIDRDERRCLTQAIYYEARNQSLTGQMAVADVVLNRVESERFPDDVCSVVFEGSTRRTGCQFSFTCDGSMTGPVERNAMIEAQTVATAVLGGFRIALTDGATNYHANYVDPYWAPTLAHTVRVGDHLFYRRGNAPTRFAILD